MGEPMVQTLRPLEQAQAALRVQAGSSIEEVAQAFGVPTIEIVRAVEKFTDAGDLQELLERSAKQFGYVGKASYAFEFFDSGGKRYTPDCAWFDREVAPENVIAIFEIDKDVSPKHLVGGMALAALVALIFKRRLRFYLITPNSHMRVAENTVHLLKTHLEEHWRLEAVVIPSLRPEVIQRTLLESLKT